MLKVVKFGGSSLSCSEQFKKVCEIINAEDTRRYVVPSAPGKRFDGDGKVTDMLYTCYSLASSGGDYQPVFDEIRERYNEIITGLGLDYSLDAEFENIKNAMLHKAGRDFAASRGEYLNALILSEYLGFDFIDAAEIIFFGEDGKFDAERTNYETAEKLKKHDRAVIPGFYGSMPNGTIKTFSRGGSDITGSIISRAAGADIYENWTDVPGFLMADPRVVKNPKVIKTITYKELRELSYMGAGVLHEDAIFPVRFADIPINIRNTNDVTAPGTMIVPSAVGISDNGIVTGIAGRGGFSVITVEKDQMNSELGFGRRFLQALEEEGISFEHLPSGIDTMGVIVRTEYLEGRREKITEKIRAAVKPEIITIDDGLALIAIVGRHMVSTKGTAARVFGAAANAGVNIRMIDQGSCELNIIIAVSDSDLNTAISAIYDEFNK